MEGFSRIDPTLWARAPYFEHFDKNAPCMFSITARLDISKALDSGRKLYPVMVHSISSVVNRHDEFRVAKGEDGALVVFDELVPSYTIFNEDAKTFTNVWTESGCSLGEFCERYERDVSRYRLVTVPAGKPDCPVNAFPISMIPWIPFTGFSLELKRGYEYYFPIFTMGKFSKDGDSTTIPVSVQVNHAVCDAYHVSILLKELQDVLDSVV